MKWSNEMKWGLNGEHFSSDHSRLQKHIKFIRHLSLDKNRKAALLLSSLLPSKISASTRQSILHNHLPAKLLYSSIREQFRSITLGAGFYWWPWSEESHFILMRGHCAVHSFSRPEQQGLMVRSIILLTCILRWSISITLFGPEEARYSNWL